MILFLITVCYVIMAIKLFKKFNDVVKCKREMEDAYSGRDVLLNAQFSSKATNYNLYGLVITTVLLLGLWMYSVEGVRGMADMFDIKKTTAKNLHLIIKVGFGVSVFMFFFSAWLRNGICGQSLLIREDRIKGISASIEKLSISHIPVDILMKDIKEVIYLNGERAFGIRLSTLVIITENDRYEYVMPVDGEAIKRLIDSKIK